MTSDERLGRARYVLLTTYRRDGTPVPTPMWVALDGGDLVMWTLSDSGKVKRLRRSGQVEVAVCNRRGAVDDDEPSFGAHATVHDDQPTRSRVRAAMAAKYRPSFALVDLIERLFVRRGHRVVLRIRVS